MKQNASQHPKAISVTYDTANNQIIILCSDGTLWRRVYIKSGAGDTWHWQKFDGFTG